MQNVLIITVIVLYQVSGAKNVKEAASVHCLGVYTSCGSVLCISLSFLLIRCRRLPVLVSGFLVTGLKIQYLVG